MKKVAKISIIGLIFLVLLAIFFVNILYNLSDSISQLKKQISSLEKELNTVEQKISYVNDSIRNVENDISKELTKLNTINSEINILQSGKKYELHDPTYAEVEIFIYQDETNEKPYDDEMFNCGHYAQEVNNNAEEQGIRCAYVSVNFTLGERHALVAFNTTNKGLLYYEPQLDKKAYLDIGKYYWGDCVHARPGYYFVKDIATIVDSFELIW